MKDETEIGHLKISNIKFGIYKKRPKAYHYRMQTQLAPPQNYQNQQRRNSDTLPSPLNHSSLIPHTNIRTSFRKASQTIKEAAIKFQYPNASYSMFPSRKPKSFKATRSYFPVSREKLKLRMRSEGTPQKMKSIDFRSKRMEVNSCLDIKEKEDSSFVRYGHNSLQTQYIYGRPKTLEREK